MTFCAIVSILIASFAPSDVPPGLRLAFLAMLLIPVYLAWKGTLHGAALLGGIGGGFSLGTLCFLGLCLADLLEAKYGTAIACVTIGLCSGIIGILFARYTLLPASLRSQSSSHRVCDALIVLTICSIGLMAIFLAGNRYLVWTEQKELRYCHTISKWGAEIILSEKEFPWWIERFIVDAVQTPVGICFYGRLPENAEHLLEHFDSIEILDLHGKAFDDAAFARLPTSWKLNVLLLSHTRITDEGIKQISRWPSLMIVYGGIDSLSEASKKWLADLEARKWRRLNAKKTASGITPEQRSKLYLDYSISASDSECSCDVENLKYRVLGWAKGTFEGRPLFELQP